MDKGPPHSLFVNDGSFMARFKQLQQEQGKGKNTKLEDSKPIKVVSRPLTPNPSIGKATDARKTSQAGSSGKLAFSLKQKSKLVPPPIKLTDEDEEETNAGDVSNDAPSKRQKLGQDDDAEQSSRPLDVAPPSPSDPTVKKVADKLASFVAKNGRQFEDVTRQKNPGDTPFKFLFDERCADYKYYEYRLGQEEKTLLQYREPQAIHYVPPLGTSISSSRPANGPQRSSEQRPTYQIPASALYESGDVPRTSGSSVQALSVVSSAEPSGSSNADSLALMEFYMKKAAREERSKQPKQSKDEMPPPASLQGKKGHHMGDYIPLEELEKFMASCNDAGAQKVLKETAEKAKIQADNVGHKLLSKMGWKEGEGLGGSRKGISDPIMAGNVKKDHLGVGAVQPGEVTSEDDIYEQYKKRMMLGYRHRPNPLNNPRKAYY
ncbi:SURP and G-patch domain-containing protein 1-like protein [Lotus japonicus]|uniref:SURP and G-patch domain-containing protein 1-like protein n=1 Tax=Lotus japonicus TaxID=34305 RepID=UPI00258B0553|nr:SURP and G-patch domain-containing protein 1-like protein [Lotus japonicus]XP_057453455.1 SURP and G-patch domain-containing protein 1-like protein [Lotus japonicus]XP_057453456.1 SURP and G-patch domain-containing protein 1-like protein [Lotus japonicus]XP_057453457.1 SURP and G-patch domain-containing protein 1-like protein [Lotus japonicus]XP_057453458.1 SURP and G-patch domain-containing protein 1-like protein [Lotus japonicus]XP_057453459.1 SURP and G-patch domain-containing protein 1-